MDLGKFESLTTLLVGKKLTLVDRNISVVFFIQ